MKFFNKLITFTLLLISANIVFADVKWVDRIVVIVNKDIITERDIDDVMNNIRSTQDKNAKIDENLLRQSAIEQLIDKKLLLQAAHFKKIIVSDEEIENSIESIANSQGISKQKLYDTIAKEGVSREMLHKTIAENLYIEKVTKQYMENIPVSDAEIQQFLSQKSVPQITQYEVQHILLKSNKYKDKDAKNELNKIKAQLKKGTSFAILASRYSQDEASAKNGGNIGWLTRGTNEESFEKVLANLKVGQVSEPVKSKLGWHLIRLNEIKQVDMSEAEKIKAAREYLAEQKMPQSYEAWLQQLRTSAYIDYRKKPY